MPTKRESNTVKLFSAIKENQQEQILSLLKQDDIDINFQNDKGKTALHLAAKLDRVEAIYSLVEWGTDVNIKDHKGQTPLFLATKQGNLAAIQALGNCRADPNITEKNDFSPIYAAAQKGHVDAIKQLYQIGGNVNAQLPSGATPMAIAAYLGKVDVIATLANLGAHVNLPNNNLDTPLHRAVREGNKAMLADNEAEIEKRKATISMLLYFGAHHNVENQNERTPIQSANKNGDNDIAKILNKVAAEKGEMNEVNGSIIVRDDDNEEEETYPLLIAASNGDIDTIKSLHAQGAHMTIRKHDGRTAVHEAAISSQKETIIKTITTLKECGAHLNIHDENGATPMHLAAIHNSIPAIGALRKSGVDINVRAPSQKTCLHFMVEKDKLLTALETEGEEGKIQAATERKNNLLTVQILLKSGADVNAVDQFGQTPLFLATLQRNTDIMKVLHEKGAHCDLPDIQDESKMLTLNTVKAIMENFGAVCTQLDQGIAYDAIFSRVKRLLNNDDLKPMIDENANLMKELIEKNDDAFNTWMAYVTGPPRSTAPTASADLMSQNHSSSHHLS